VVLGDASAQRLARFGRLLSGRALRQGACAVGSVWPATMASNR
jgi:hypothetical protein